MIQHVFPESSSPASATSSLSSGSSSAPAQPNRRRELINADAITE
jgi:hypothetical protein